VAVLLAGLRRFAVLVAIVVGVVFVLGLGYGALAHVALRRALSVTAYAVGALLMVFGVFHGIRPPLRVDDEHGIPGVFGVLLTRGRLRTATPDERADAISSSALFVVLGLLLVVLGGLLDPVHHLI
jgi:hypothetical protein